MVDMVDTIPMEALVAMVVDSEVLVDTAVMVGMEAVSGRIDPLFRFASVAFVTLTSLVSFLSESFCLSLKMSNFPDVLAPREDDIQKMLACQVHLGSRNLDPSMQRYIWKRRSDGVHLIDLQKTWEKLTLAARIIVSVENPSDVCAISARDFGQRAVLKFAKYTGATAMAGRWTPGTLTNQIQEKFTEPRLLILTDPRTDHQPIRESSYVNIPTIAFCHTDSPLNHVDVAIPCNNKGKHAIGLMWWLLAREVLYLRNAPNMVRGKPWDVMVDLFLYRAPEEQGKEEAAGEAEPAFQRFEEGGEFPSGEPGWEGQQDWSKSADWSNTEAQPSWDPSVASATWEGQHE